MSRAAVVIELVWFIAARIQGPQCCARLDSPRERCEGSICLSSAYEAHLTVEIVRLCCAIGTRSSGKDFVDQVKTMGKQTSVIGATISVAKGLRGTTYWVHARRVPGSYHRLRRTPSGSCACVLLP